MQDRQYYVYVMTNRSGMFYPGMTNNLVRRIAEHRRGLSRFTHRYRMTRLVYYETTSDVTSAITRENQIKPWRREKKLTLIRRMNPRLLDLSSEIE